MTSHALRLTVADFDACRSERDSPAAARRRVDLGRRALAWGREVEARLAALELDVEIDAPAARTAAAARRRSAESHWVIFHRGRASRESLEAAHGRRRGPAAAHRRHPFLGLLLDASKVEVACESYAGATVDLAHLRERLEDPRRAAELIAAIAALPDQFAFGTAAGPQTPCAHVTRESLRRAIDETRGATSLWIGWSVRREVALAHAPLLDELLGDALVALVPVYRLIAWAPPRGEAVPTVFEKGARVRVLRGAFAGKVGTVGELDGRGGARVLLGLLSTRVDLDALAPAVAGRPSLHLHSSHRRLSVRRSTP
jgi:hypothetical protein